MNFVMQIWVTLVLSLLSMAASAAPPMKVTVSVDVESFGKGNPDQQIWGKQPDGEHGIRRIMDLLDRHAFKGTFYLNVYEAARHGEPVIAEVARAIHQRGHDLQLHTHPKPMFGYTDMQDADYDEQLRILLRGMELIRQWTGKKVIAHRAGSYAANLDTLKAAHAAGLAIDASFSPITRSSGLSRQLSAGNLPGVVEGVAVLPVSYYIQVGIGRWQSPRLLDVEASTLDEFKSVIRQFRNGGAPVVNLMMHSFSFVRSGSANSAMERRFDQQLEFLKTEPGIEVVTVSQLYPDWTSRLGEMKPGTGPVPYTGLWLTYRRALAHAGEGGVNLAVASAPVLGLGVACLGVMFWRYGRSRHRGAS